MPTFSNTTGIYIYLVILYKWLALSVLPQECRVRKLMYIKKAVVRHRVTGDQEGHNFWKVFVMEITEFTFCKWMFINAVYVAYWPSRSLVINTRSLCQNLKKKTYLLNTVKPAHVDPSIKQSHVLNDHIFFLLSYNISYELNLF